MVILPHAPAPVLWLERWGWASELCFVFFLRESVSGAKRIETKKPNRDSILNLPPPPSTPWHFFGPQFLWLKRIPFTLGSCLAIAATRLGFVRGIWQERGKINRGDFSYFLCPICPLPLITYTHRQTPISLIWKRRCFSSTFWVHSRYTHLSVGLPLHPGQEILEERKSTPPPPNIHTHTPDCFCFEFCFSSLIYLLPLTFRVLLHVFCPGFLVTFSGRDGVECAYYLILTRILLTTFWHYISWSLCDGDDGSEY